MSAFRENPTDKIYGNKILKGTSETPINLVKSVIVDLAIELVFKQHCIASLTVDHLHVHSEY